ncbi:hypothetical protein [Nonomuraea sp. SYSU D8015]|uniref:hypothetical protein n=1 Tax=Nonomuraea sp. SYSU D8015 TaxID=2593644 RepID=UPI00166026BB|nr:hypothetical protein [Nonomuraea sp. SYSU D8015]
MKLPTLVLALLLMLSACGSEDPGISTEEFAPNVGANETFNNIMIRNAFVIGGASGSPLPPGSNAPLYVTLISHRAQPDKLVSVQAPAWFSTATIPGGSVELPPGRLVGGGPKPQAVLQGLTKQLRSGSYIAVTFTFRDAGAIQKQLPVLPPSQWRATYSPTPGG